MPVESIRKGRPFVKSYVIRVVRDENGKVKDIVIEDGFYIVYFTAIRDNEGKIQSFEYYEGVM